MPDVDRFDNADYSTDEIAFEDESTMGQVTAQAGKAIPILKKYSKHIIAVLVLLAVGWFAYDYFIGSILNVTVTIQDTEGRSLEDNSIKLYEESGKEPIYKDSDSSVYTISLKPGRYRYEVIATNYAPKKSSFTVSAEETNPLIELSQDIDVTILDFEQSFPTKLFVGGSKTFTVTLKNHADSSISVELLGEDDIEGMVNAGSLTIPGNSTKEFDVAVVVPAGEEVKEDEEGDPKKAKIRIKYSTENAEADFVLYPNPKDEIKVDSASFSVSAKEAKNKDDKTISVENDNKFPIEDLELSVEITGASNNSIEDVLSWFRFTDNLSTDPDKHKVSITSITGREEAKKVLQVEIPMTAQKESDITGNLVLTAPWLSEPIKAPLTLNIKEGAEFSIELSIDPRNPVEIDWDTGLGKYKDVPVTLTIDNTGKLEIQNIVISIQNESVCNRDWLEILENNVESLGAGNEKDLALMASAPPAARADQPKRCNIRYTYTNPTGSGPRVEEVLTNFIEIVPQEP